MGGPSPGVGPDSIRMGLAGYVSGVCALAGMGQLGGKLS